jgi:hypothetical protein
MLRIYCVLLLCFLNSLGSSLQARELSGALVGPYLQNATPNSIWIHWVSDTHPTMTLEWGETEDTMSRVESLSIPHDEGGWYHHVHLEQLQAGTLYHYRIRINEDLSEMFHLKTPNHASDEASFSIVAMSDMQIDRARPEQFRTVIEDGVIPFVHEHYGLNLSEEISMILIPGDLVKDGNIYPQWASEFFAPSESLLPYIPLYPVPGNHERNSPYYFEFFNVPNNGTTGFEEHWYFIDHSNVRVIGMDSNALYGNPIQLSWLEEVLEDSCDQEDIDFVFAQLHHPHHSELWPDGNTNFTGEVIERLEQFSTACQKPSIHFFGHTHGYSRGQSRDHRHLMVNVASAGGNIDYWDEYDQVDYEEYTVSQDEYGFVMVDVDAGDDPLFSLTRVSLGNENQTRQREVRDQITVHLHNTPPVTPQRTRRLGNQVNPNCFILTLSEFEDEDDDKHMATQWQVALTCDDFTNPIVNRWKQNENWYRGEDLQQGDLLSDEIIEDLTGNTSYCWRARYRDTGLQWSVWSTPEAFTTKSEPGIEYPLLNGSAEDGTMGWVVEEGNFESLGEMECNGISPFEGERYFAVGGLCDSSERAVVSQAIDISQWSTEIESQELHVKAHAYVRNWNGADIPQLGLHFVNVSGEILTETKLTESTASNWTHISVTLQAPLNATMAILTLYGNRNSGNDNDSYFDAIQARVLLGEVSCDQGNELESEEDDMMMVDFGMVSDMTHHQHTDGMNIVDQGLREIDQSVASTMNEENNGEMNQDPSMSESNGNQSSGGCTVLYDASKITTLWPNLSFILIGLFIAIYRLSLSLFGAKPKV